MPLIYDIFSKRNPGFDRGVFLRPPTDATEWAKNTNGDGHTLYADRGEGGELVWREAHHLSEAGQKRHGVGPIIERRQERQAEALREGRRLAAFRAELAEGDRVAAGEGEDRDTGVVVRLESESRALIHWDGSGVTAPARLADLEPTT